jgi:hypothetical protein
MSWRIAVVQRKNVILLVANLLGSFVYLWLGSWTWTPANERGLGLDSAGDFMIWGLSALPVLIVFFVLDFGWAVVILIRRQWKSGLSWLLVAIMWFIALAIDRAHHS